MTTTLIPASAPPPSPELRVDDEPCFVIEGLRYEQYAAISEAMADRSNPRLIFLDGRLTLLSPSRSHDWGAECLCDIVKAVAIGCGLAFEPARTSTYRREDVDGGVEGDGAFYLGPNAAIMQGPKNIDLSTQPPPDIAIEVEVTHKAEAAISVWGRLGVPEVWHYDAPRHALNFFHRGDDGIYRPVEHSPGLPALTTADVIDQVRQADQLGYGVWYGQLADWVRDVIAPRLGGGA